MAPHTPQALGARRQSRRTPRPRIEVNMAIAIRAPKDFWPGLMFVATGVGAVVIGRESSMGTATKMGPAYFPTVLGGLLAIIGLVLIGRAVVTPGGGIGA